MALHLIEFTWFHYSRTVLAFCCTCPQFTLDGCYPLWLLFGVRTFLLEINSRR